MSREAAKERYEQQPGEPSIGFVDTVDVIAAIDITYDDMEAGDSAVLDAVGGVSDASGARFDVIEADEWVVEGRLAAGAVTSDKILNGSIQDEDINAAADIARSKIAGTALTTGSTGVFSVLDYGATGDGVTDDTDAIQDALDAGAGGTVLLPPGSYKLTSYISVPASTCLSGDGATLTGAFPSGGSGAVRLGDHTKVRGLTVVNTHGAGGDWGLTTNSSSDVVITECTIRGPWLVGLAMTDSSDIRITNNLFDSIGMVSGPPSPATPGEGIAMLRACDVTVSGNTFVDGLGCAVYIATSSNVTVVGNTVRDQPEGVKVRVTCEDVTITSNVFTIKGSSVVPSFGVLAQTDAVNTVVSGNTFRTVAGTAAPTAAVLIDNQSHRTTVMGNTVKGLFDYGVALATTAGGGTESVGCIISGNEFDSLATNAINVEADSLHTVISGNRINGGGIGGAGIFAAADYCTIAGNSVLNAHGLYGMRLYGDHCAVTGNVVTGTENLSGFAIAGTDNAVTGNVATGNAVYGIDESGDRNLIVGNNCGDNTDATYDIVHVGASTVVDNNIGRV